MWRHGFNQFCRMDSRTEVRIKEIKREKGSFESCYRIVLEDKDAMFTFPVIVSAYDVKPIIYAFEKKIPDRPHTHDLFESFIQRSGTLLLDVSIVHFDKGVFYAKLSFLGLSGPFVMDSRVSDALALALRSGAPVYIENTVIKELGIIDLQSETAEDGEIKNYKAEIARLENRLQQLVATECYEDAATLRDRIKELKMKDKGL